MISVVLAVVFALVASAFCSIAEATFYSFPRSTAEALAKKNSHFGKYLMDIKLNMERYIASVLILNTLANTFGVFLATRAATNHLSEQHQLILPWVLAALILIFGEIVPKTLGVQQSKRFAPVLGFFFYYLTKGLSFTGLIQLSVKLTRRLTGEKKQEYTREDIQSLAQIGLREGIIDSQQALVIQNILALKSMTVRSVMTPRQVVFSLPAEATINASILERGNWPFSRIPIYSTKKDLWIGQVLRRDAYNALASGKGDLPLKKILRPLQMVPDSMSVDALLHRFLKQRAHLVGVVDEYGSLAGIASLEDVLEGLLGREIVDEFDESVDLQEQARQSSVAIAAMNISKKYPTISKKLF